MKQSLQTTWDLDPIFPGGSRSKQFAVHMEKLAERVELLKTDSMRFKEPSSSEEPLALIHIVELLQEVTGQIREASAFIECLQAQNVHDEKAHLWHGSLVQLDAELSTATTILEEKLMKIDEEIWLQLLKDEALAPIAFYLNERRTQAGEKRPPAEEEIIHQLSIDGYHAWGQLYDTLVGKMKIPFTINGKTILLSVGQAQNQLSHSDRNIRKEVFHEWEKAWAEKEDLFSATLNHLAGFRLQVYKKRGFSSVLKEPLNENRMKEATLNSMWQAVDEAKPKLLQYLKEKAKLIGVKKISWYDLEAPIVKTSKTYTYDEGAAFIVKHFKTFSPKMSEFAEMALSNRWIEAENRPGKQPGGFCTSFPLKKQSRIFMTYEGTLGNISTLAHELGHGFHQFVMDGMPEFTQQYAMNVAETASTLAEQIVSDAAYHEAETIEEKQLLLDDKVQRTVAFFMDIHARFLFETSFYEERKKGLVPVERINELMINAQKTAFVDGLSEYHPHFWASKLHFYITDVPFYNFPYTFGYLFSLGIYHYAKQQSASFEDQYIALLQDTGRMTVEQLAQKHLHIDITKADFWRNAVNVALKDVNEFLSLV